MLILVVAIAVAVYLSLLGRINALQRRVSALESKLDVQQHLQRKHETPAAVMEPARPVPTPAPSEQYRKISQESEQAAPAVDKIDIGGQEEEDAATGMQPAAPSAWEQTTASIFALIKKNPFATAGVLMMLIGAGFLFSLLAINNILPPSVRILSVALAGVAVFAVGLRQATSRTLLGLNLQGGALALEYLCTLWAYQGYNLIGTSTAFVCLAGLSTLAFAWSVRTERVLFAFIGLAGALLTPIIASTGEGTFAALSLYATWISLLSVAVGLRLHAPSLVGAALAGSSALLGAAVDLPRGTTSYTIAMALCMALAYNAAALFWTNRADYLNGARRASVVSVMTGASLIMAGFMYLKAGVSSGWCATVIGVTALVQLCAMRRAVAQWKGWLLAIGGGLSLIAIGVGLDGATRVIALAASALGFILIAHALEKALADIGAALYWVVSAVASYHAWEHGGAGVTPLAVCALVAIGASFLHKERRTGLFYAACAPLALDVALLQERFDDPTWVLSWFLGWAVLATFAGRRLHWMHMRLSALWLGVAGLYLFVSPHTDTSMSGWNTREALLIAWLAGSAVLMRLYNRDPDAPIRFDQDTLGFATLLVPVLANIELARAFATLHFSGQVALAASILLWSAWSVIARAVTFVARFDWQARQASIVAAGLTAMGVATAPPAALTELSHWAAVVLLTGVAAYSDAPRRLPTQALWGLAGAVLAGSLLRAIGSAHGLHEGALALLFERVMQPWVSVFWAAAGVVVVMTASRRMVRHLWIGGGIALAVLVVKMLLIDLSALTLVAKVTVFLVVGLGFIGLGYFCPLPPEQEREAGVPE